MIRTNQISEPSTLSEPHAITVDLMPHTAGLLNLDAVKLMNNKVGHVIYQYNVLVNNNKYADMTYMIADLLEKLEFKHYSDFNQSTYVRKAARAFCFGFVVDQDRVADALVELCKSINHMASNKHALATLSAPISLILSTGRHCVITYLHIDDQYESLVQSTYAHCSFNEGSIPPELP